jgi:polysaccharide biosynthesis/export protein
MTNKLSFVFLLSCALCSGQSTMTVPNTSSRTSATDTGMDASTQPCPTLAEDEGNSPHPCPTTTGDDTRQEPAALRNLARDAAKAEEEGHTPESTREAGPITVRSDFEKFAEDGVGYPLRVYGRTLFNGVPSTFAPVDHIPVPANYSIGPGDQLLIRAWGKIDLDSVVTVDRNGQISLPKVGTLDVVGLRYDQLDGYLRTSIGSIYKGFELNVTLGHLRSIQVFVLGSARQPGEYTVSSLSTLVNALLASGGPSATGSMRHIQLRRADKLQSEFDVYDLLRKGDKSHDVQLLSGDVIFIPPVGAQVAISGSVNEPGIYELRGETTVNAALEEAGGLTELAATQRVLLERIDDHSVRKVEEFSLDASGLQRPLQDGDLLRIDPISPKFENALTLQGSVAQPGRYVWKEGMRVSDLIPSRDFLITRNHWNRTNHLTPSDANHEFGISRTDQLGSSSTDQYGNVPTDQLGSSTIDRNRSLRTNQLGSMPKDQAGNSPTDQYGGLHADEPDNSHTDIADDVGKNSAEINWEYAVIERLDDHDLSTQLIPFHLANAIDNHASTDNQVLKAGDVVTIFSRASLELPIDEHASFVRLSGEVDAPGIYRIKSGETLKEVVAQAGGLTPHSYLYASQLTRVSTRLAQEAQLKKYTEQVQRELLAQNMSASSGPSATDQQAQLAMQQSLIASLSSVKPTGRIVLKMRPAAAAVGDIPYFTLEDGDAFYIPPTQNTVEVSGAVYNESAYRYERGKRARAYLNDAGGPTRNADRKRAFIIHADGSVVSRQNENSYTHGNFDKSVLLPGDALVVPAKLKSSFNMQSLANWAQLASSTAVTAATVSILK